MDIAEIDQKGLLAQVEGNTEIASWSEARQNEFVATFNQRSKVTRYILISTAEIVWSTALRRHFISPKHYRAIVKDLVANRDHHYQRENFDELKRSLYEPGDHRNYHVGGRETTSLDLVAQQRAKTILANLPPLAKAVSVVDAETSKKIDRKAKIEAEGNALNEKIEAVCGVISMKEQDPKMTIGEFLAMVQDREDQRQKLIKRMNVLAAEGQKLESEISKALFAGLPGLSDAVVAVIRSHVEQALAFDQTSRRVEEQVKFGNSTAAVELLRNFEKDEVTVSDEVKAQFEAALEKLKISAKTPKKKAGKELRG
jgi:hypothetical protein